MTVLSTVIMIVWTHQLYSCHNTVPVPSRIPQSSLSCVCNKHNTNSGLLLNALAGSKEYSRNRENSSGNSARPYSSSDAGSGVVLRHRATAAACACLTVDVAATEAYCTLEGAAQIRPIDGFLHNHCPNLRSFTKGFFLTWFCTSELPCSYRKLFSYLVYGHMFIQCMMRFDWK